MNDNDYYTIMPNELVAALDARGQRKAVIVRDLARYYGLLKQGMKSIDGLFTSNEYLFLADISTSSVMDANYTETLPYNIEDALEDYGVKWESNHRLRLAFSTVRRRTRSTFYALMWPVLVYPR